MSILLGSSEMFIIKLCYALSRTSWSGSLEMKEIAITFVPNPSSAFYAMQELIWVIRKIIIDNNFYSFNVYSTSNKPVNARMQALTSLKDVYLEMRTYCLIPAWIQVEGEYIL